MQVELNPQWNEIFTKYFFPEAKAFITQFITVITAVLVLSIAFAEKIVNLQNADRTAKIGLVSMWGFLLIALVTCGASYWFFASVGLYVIQNVLDYNIIRDYLIYAMWLLRSAAICFLISITLMVTIAARSMLFPKVHIKPN
jgi:hypothetical protein